MPVGVLAGLALGGVLVAVRARGVLRTRCRQPRRRRRHLAGTRRAGLAAVAIVLAVAAGRRSRPGRKLAAQLRAIAAVGVPVLESDRPRRRCGPLPVSAIVSLVIAVGLRCAIVDTTARLAARLLPQRPAAALEAWSRRLRSWCRGAGRCWGWRPLFAAACCSLVFASGYQQPPPVRLDQAAAQVPLDVRVGPSSRVAVPLDVLDSERLHRVSPEVAIYPVVTSPVTAFAGTTQAKALPLTGIDRSALPAMHEFAATTGSTLPAAELAALLNAGQSASDPAPVLPAGVNRIDLHAAGMSSDITLNLGSAPQRAERQVQFTGTGPNLTARIDPGPALYVRAIEIAESAHISSTASTPSERAQRTASYPVAIWCSDRSLPAAHRPPGTGPAGAAIRPRSAAGTRRRDARVRTRSATPASSSPWLRAPPAAEPLPVAVDPGTAARAGEATAFGISVNGVTIPVRIVAILTRLPAVGSSFVLRTARQSSRCSTAPRQHGRRQPGLITAPGAALDGVVGGAPVLPAAAASLSYRPTWREACPGPGGDPLHHPAHDRRSHRAVLAMAAATAVRADLPRLRRPVRLELDGRRPHGCV